MLTQQGLHFALLAVIAIILVCSALELVLSASVASYFVGQQTEADMTDLHRRLDRIKDMLARALDSERD